MGLDYAFYVEVRTEGAWHVPSSLEPPTQWSRAGEFLWTSAKRGSMDLFFGPYALFSFTKSIPPQWETSEFYAYLAQFYDFQENGWRISWIPYDALFIDDWHSEQVLVSGRVNVEYAHHFGDGTSTFPEAALLATGMQLWEVEDLRCGNLIENPINRCYGKPRQVLTAADPGTPIPVTWRDTICGFVGDGVACSFLNLRRFGHDADLRVISTLS